MPKWQLVFLFFNEPLHVYKQASTRHETHISHLKLAQHSQHSHQPQELSQAPLQEPHEPPSNPCKSNPIENLRKSAISPYQERSERSQRPQPTSHLTISDMHSSQFFTLLFPFLFFFSFANAYDVELSFTLTREANGFYSVEGSCWYKDDFSGIAKHENFQDRSGSNFFNNSNKDIGWYIDLPSANVKITHNARTFDMICSRKIITTYSWYYDCNTNH